MKLYITDKSGKQFWRTTVDAGYSSGERANLTRRLQAIKAHKPAFAFVDSATARLVEEPDVDGMTVDELINELR